MVTQVLHEMRSQHLPRRLALVIGVVVVAAIAQSVISNPEDPSYFLLFYPAVMVCAWFGGASAVLLATLLSVVAAAWLFMDPVHTLRLTTARQWYSLTVFVVMGVAFSWWRGRLSEANGRVRLLSSEFDRERMKRTDAELLLARLRDNLQDESERLRHELALEIHDEIGATLTAIGMRLDSLRRQAERDAALDAGEIEAIRSLVGRAAASSREVCTRLRPAMLDDLGLIETCRWYLADWSKNTGIEAEDRIDAMPVPPDGTLAIDLFRIFQELLTNVARHSRAKHVRVSLRRTAVGLEMEIRDDGRGLSPGRHGGLGLTGIQERLRRHGGRFAIRSTGQGTLAHVKVPLESEAAADPARVARR